MRKIISMLTAVCMLICGFCVNASAEASTNAADPGISPMNLYTSSISTSMSKTGSTSITYNCSVVGKSTATDIWIFLYLQEYQSDGTWKNVDGKTIVENSRSAYVSDTYTKAVTGKRYRTKAVVHTYSGTKVEKLTAYSAVGIF